jgi:biotin transport system substrate-specific component
LTQLTATIDSFTKTNRTTLRLLGCAVFALLTALSAHIRIYLPFTPVPMTLQTLFVPLAGGFLGAAWGGASMLLYLALGALGLNVFAGPNSGLSFLAAPTGGYLVGFFFAAALVGFVKDRTTGYLPLFLGVFVAQQLIFVFGVAGLMLNAGMNFQEAFLKGVLPFLAGDLIKTAASYLILISYHKLLLKK